AAGPVDPDRDDLVAFGIQGVPDRRRRRDGDLVLGRTPAEHQHDPCPTPGAGRVAHTASSACSKSAIRSSTSSAPTDTRIRPDPMPAASRSASGIWRCDVVAGWQISVCSPPNDDPTRATRMPLHATDAASYPPFSVNASIAPNRGPSKRAAAVP